MTLPLFTLFLVTSQILASTPAQQASIDQNTALPSNVLRSKTLYQANPGPWGNLEYYIAYLQATESQIEAIEFPEDVTEWHFHDTDPKRIEARIQKCLVSSPAPDWLHSKRSCVKMTPDETLIYPPESWLENLTSEERSNLASLLREHPDNTFYNDPIIIESGDAIRWFSRAGLEPKWVNKIAALAYPYGDTLVFSDIPLVLKLITKQKDERQFMRSLTRTRTLVVRLRIDGSAEPSQVYQYWNIGQRGKNLLPILESVFETPEAETLDVVHLLPPTPRKLLYSYPEQSMMIQGVLPDCHWTSLNFFRRQPSARFLDEGQVKRELQENYHPVDQPLQFGDILLLSSAQNPGMIQHSCVYIADDIVYTKNGLGLMRPWILMRFGDMLTRYQLDGKINTQAYRKNE